MMCSFIQIYRIVGYFLPRATPPETHKTSTNKGENLDPGIKASIVKSIISSLQLNLPLIFKALKSFSVVDSSPA